MGVCDCTEQFGMGKIVDVGIYHSPAGTRPAARSAATLVVGTAKWAWEGSEGGGLCAIRSLMMLSDRGAQHVWRSSMEMGRDAEPRRARIANPGCHSQNLTEKQNGCAIIHSVKPSDR